MAAQSVPPGDLTLYVERLIEPYSGMPLLGVGGLGPPALRIDRVDIRYDGRPASIAVPEVIADAGGRRLHFSTQLPVEPAVERVQIVAIAGGVESTLYDESMASVGQRREPESAGEVGGFLTRGMKSIVSGEALSPARWRARVGRFATLALRARQKVRTKLLMRKHRPCDPHLTCAANTAVTPALRAAMAAEAQRFHYRPTVSVLLPVWNSDPGWLSEAVESVRDQVYERWELCIADDASTNPEHLRFLDRLPKDARIKIVRRPVNGHICANTNSAADLAAGEFVALLDHDDKLAPDALFEVARLLQDDPAADLVYTDEDKIDPAGRRFDPQFKPDWSPELLLSYNYINHFTCIRRSVFEKAGRFRVGLHGSQDHDLLLRVTELTDRVRHVPRILYHWRSHPESTASTAGQKTYVHTSGRRAVEDALARRKIDATLYVPPFADRLGLPILGLDGPDDGPAVAVLVIGDSADQTARAVDRNTDYRNVSIQAVLADGLNRAVAGRTEEFVLFLDAGVEPADPRWLSRLVTFLRLPGVGAVGGLIRAQDGSVVSAGTLLGMRDGIAPDDACRGLPKDAISYYFYAEVGRNVSATGRGCLLTRRDVFLRLGGFTDSRALADVDYCLRLREIGLRSVHVGGAELTAAGGRSSDPTDLLAFKQTHGRPRDPFSNPNLSDRDSFRPVCDGPPSLLAAADTPAVRALVAAHNLNSPEGAPRYLSEIVLGLRGWGRIEPSVFSPLGGAGEGVYREVGVPVTVADAPWGRRFVDGRWKPREYEAAQTYLARLIRDRRPGVVVANTLLTFPVVEAAARAGVPAVWIIHESYSPGVLARVFPPYARARIEAAFALAARVVPASHDTAKLFAHWNTRGNVRVLHNGLDPTPFDDYCRRVSKADAARRVPGDPGKKRVIAVGTVCERKGQHTLVEAAAALAETRSDFACYLVGMRPGVPYTDYVRELVRRHRLENVVHLIEETDDVWRFYRAADVFACTSYVETFSRAVLEAEAFGLPIVSTPCCGLSEQVFWDFNALPFDFGDAAGLAAQLGRLLDDDGLRAGMAEKSRAAFDNHLSYDEMLDRYDSVIRAAARPVTRLARSRPWNLLGIGGGYATRVGR
jgi:glycosyltransferase involved in cell wall biosynthesis/GT2 family glycosyltransferase